MRLLSGLLLCTLTAFAAERPNIIFILTDDQGYGDVGAHGNPVLKTPNLDKLHAESVRFTDFQVSPTCSPTRSALLTGRHEFKNGITHTILERERMALGAVTLTQQLQKAGYRTGIFGKWHLGDEAEYQPNKRGFDEVYIHGAGGIGQELYQAISLNYYEDVSAIVLMIVVTITLIDLVCERIRHRIIGRESLQWA